LGESVTPLSHKASIVLVVVLVLALLPAQNSRATTTMRPRTIKSVRITPPPSQGFNRPRSAGGAQFEDDHEDEDD
jgi:hypothetical protein